MNDDDFKAEERSSYRFWNRDILRYGDIDSVGHVNNNAYGLYIENARTMLFHQTKVMVTEAGGTVDYDWVLRRLEIDYLREVRYPGEVETGLACTRMGNSSMILRVGVFTADYCAATSVGVSVCFDVNARASMPIPEDMRRAILDLTSAI